MIDITNLAIGIVTVISGIIAAYLIPYLKERYTKEQLEKALSWANIAVAAADQLAKSGVINLEDRKYYAMKVLESKNIKLDIEALSDIVEACVLGLPKLIIDEKETEVVEEK